MGIKIKLVKSPSSASEKQVATVKGLGVWKFGSERLLKDTPAIRGMLDRVRHLLLADRRPHRVRIRDARPGVLGHRLVAVEPRPHAQLADDAGRGRAAPEGGR